MAQIDANENGNGQSGEMPVEILSEEDVFNGKFIKTLRTTIRLPPKEEGKPGAVEVWETVKRHQKGAINGVFCLPIIKYADGRSSLVTIKQFRICMKGYCLEIPGGHLDYGETPEQAAIRELKEETGYTGRVIRVSDGISVEACSVLVNMHQTIVVVVDGDDAINQNVTPECPEDEHELIEVILIPMDHLLSTLKHYATDEKLYIATVIYMFAFGHSFATNKLE